MTTTTPTQHCDSCGEGPFFHIAERAYPTLCIDCGQEAARHGLLTFIEGTGMVWFPSSATNAAIRREEARI